jgi:flagellar hook-length control protein FliK
VAAVAAHALASASGAALSGGKPFAALSGLAASDSSFASVLAQLANAAGSQPVPQASPLPSFSFHSSPAVSGPVQPAQPNEAQANETADEGPSPSGPTSAALPASAVSALPGNAWNGASPLPGNVPSYAQSLLDGSAAPTASGTTSHSLAQQAASSWLRQMTAQTPPSGTAAAQAPAPQGAAATNPATSSSPIAQWTSPPALQQIGAASASLNQPHFTAQQAAAAWLQQMSTAGPAGTTPPALQAGAQSQAGAQPNAAPPTAQSASQTPPWLQQIQAANAHVTTTQTMPTPLLPNGVSTYAQSLQQGQTQSAVAQSAGSAANTAPAVPATILAANSTQSVAAMFSVPSFPTAMAFATPANSKAQTLTGTTNAAVPSSGDAGASQSGPSSSPPVTTTGPLSPAAQSENNKAAVLAQAEQASVRAGHAAQVTEQHALPLNFDASEATAASKPDGAHADFADTEKSSPAADDHSAAPDAVQLASSQAQVVHSPAAAEAVPVQQAAATPASGLPASADTPVFSVQSQPTGAQAAAPAAAGLPSAPASVPGAPDINALAMSIAAKSLDGSRQFDIRLDPAELGRVDVRLSLDGAGTAQAHLSAERPETLSLLQNNAPALTRALQDSGVQVANNGLQFSLKGQDRQSGDAEPRAPSRSRASAAQSISAAASLSGTASAYGLSPSGSGVNILV